VAPFGDGVASAQGAPAYTEPPNLAALEKAAAKEGQLDISWGNIYGGAEGARRVQEGIARKYGVTLHVNYNVVAVGAVFQNQVIEEVRAGQRASTDILFHIRDAQLAKYTQAADFRKYVPGLPDGVMYYDKHSVVLVTTILAEEYNSKLIPKDKVPTSLADLLQPQWKGKIATPPYEGVLAWYLGLPEALGKDGMIKYFTALSGQLGGLITCGASDRVINGEFLIFGLDCGDYEVRLRQRLGQPIAAFYPKEGTSLYTFAPGIPQTAAHPAAARLFISYLLTREGQNLLWDVMASDDARIPGSHMAALIAEQRKHGVKFIDTYGADLKHPELIEYQGQINKLVNQAK